MLLLLLLLPRPSVAYHRIEEELGASLAIAAQVLVAVWTCRPCLDRGGCDNSAAKRRSADASLLMAARSCWAATAIATSANHTVRLSSEMRLALRE